MNDKVHYRVYKGNNDFLHVQVRLPQNNIQQCNIIFVHGFLGNGVENHRMFIRISERLNEIGYTCILFDQSGCGYSDGDYQSVCLEDLRKDIKIISLWVAENIPGKIAFLGQSLGSALILSENFQFPVAFKIAINPVANFNKWLVKRYGWDLKSDNNYFCAIPKGIWVSRSFIIGLINWNWLLNVSESNIPVLLIASCEDEIGADEICQELIHKLGKSTSLCFIEKANHSFIGQRDLEIKAIENIIDWLNDIRCCV